MRRTSARDDALVFGQFGAAESARKCLKMVNIDWSSQEYGVPVTTAWRAIRELEKAGLVAIVRRPGRGLEVTLLDARPPDQG